MTYTPWNHTYCVNWDQDVSDTWGFFFANLHLFDSVSIAFVTLHCGRILDCSNPLSDEQ